MSNTRDSTDYHEYATVDEGSSTALDYFTNPVNMREKGLEKVFFSVRETGASTAFTATITLQFRCKGDGEWNDYDTYTGVVRKLIEGGGAGVQWRAGIKDDDYTSGEVTFGFDW